MDDLFTMATAKLLAVMSAQDQIAEDFEIWKLKPGANHVLSDLFAMAAPYAKRYRKTGQRVSIKLLWELERDRIKSVKKRLKRRGMDLREWRSYTLNNIFTALIARHIMDRRGDWDGMFELRKRGSE